MALVVMCGQPCSGKSTAAACLSDALAAVDPRPTVRIIDESSLHLGRNQSYADMTVEKNLRGVLRSEVDRSVSRDSIIVVDSLNNIKDKPVVVPLGERIQETLQQTGTTFAVPYIGYRYELWCLARAAGIRYCVIYCDTGDDHCREWNNQRQENGQSSYETKIFEDLVRRFERPDRRNRWDSPLFELFPSKGWSLGDESSCRRMFYIHKDLQYSYSNNSSPVIAEAVSYLTRKVDSKTRDVKVLQPTIATSTVRSTEANTLYEMDRATQEVINVIVEAQSQSLGGIMSRISVGEHLPTIDIRRPVGLPELRSLRRTFIKLTGQYSLSGPPPPSDADSAKRMFVDYLNREIGAA